MYDKIKNDIAQEYYLKNYPNDGQRFVAWYLRNIHNNEALLAMKSYMSFHHLFAVSVLVCESNKMQDLVPNPALALLKLKGMFVWQ